MHKSKRFQPILLAALLVAVAGAVIYLIVEGSVGRKEIGIAFLAMIGTFVGAVLAFRLTEYKEQRAEVRRQKIALNSALFALLRQYNAMRWLQKSMAPYQQDYDRAFNCPALTPPAYKDLVHDFDSLAFLFEEEIDPSLLMRLSIEQEGFEQALESLRVRNQFYVDEVQPAISKLGFNKKSVPAAEFENALGERLFEVAKNGAVQAYQNIDHSCASLLALHSELFTAAKRLFPDTKFVKLAPEA